MNRFVPVCEEEFLIGARKLLQRDESCDDQTATMFKALDVQGAGFLTLDSIRDVFLAYSPHISAAVVEDAFFEADSAGTGRVRPDDARAPHC